MVLVTVIEYLMLVKSDPRYRQNRAGIMRMERRQMYTYMSHVDCSMG